MSKVVGRVELLKRVLEKSKYGTSRQETSAILTAFVSAIEDCLMEGKDVIIEELGTWRWEQGPTRKLNDIRTKELVEYPSQRILRYRFNRVLRVNARKKNNP